MELSRLMLAMQRPLLQLLGTSSCLPDVPWACLPSLLVEVWRFALAIAPMASLAEVLPLLRARLVQLGAARAKFRWLLPT